MSFGFYTPKLCIHASQKPLTPGCFSCLFQRYPFVFASRNPSLSPAEVSQTDIGACARSNREQRRLIGISEGRYRGVRGGRGDAVEIGSPQHAVHSVLSAQERCRVTGLRPCFGCAARGCGRRLSCALLREQTADHVTRPALEWWESFVALAQPFGEIAARES